MNFAILDDNATFLKSVKKAVSQYAYDIPEFTYFTKAEDFLKHVSENSNNIQGVFIDIVLDDTGSITGMSVAKKVCEINNNIDIVFVTGFVKEYCQNIFLSDLSITPFAFLTKPLDKNVLYKIFRKFTENEHAKRKGKILIKTAREYIYLNPDEICYLESQKRMVKFSLVDKTEHQTYGKITDYTDSLSNFQYSHKSFFVNLSCVKVFSASEILMVNDQKIPISQRYQKQFKEKLLLDRGINNDGYDF